MSDAAENHDPEAVEPDIAPTPEVEPEAIARALQAVLEEKEKEIAALKDQGLRALAEVENTRRRAERELADMSKYAVTGFARELVSVLENLQRAVDSIPADLKEKEMPVANLATGVEMTLGELLGVFGKHGIQRIDPMGQKFDHNFHQAVAQIETPDAAPGTVVQVLQAGYVIHDRLLRPAMVGVAAAGGSATQKVDTSA
jgi:molecular chaperone GrpE